MDNSLLALCSALKKIFSQLKPHTNPISFLLLISKTSQGKTSILRQSQLNHLTVDAELTTEIYYNHQGVIVEINETWLIQSKNLLQYTLKQLNHCHRHVKITGLILCIEINQLFSSDPQQLTAQLKTHTQLLERFGSNLGYRIDLALLFSKLDQLAGFCDFFQYEHTSELQKPFGFSWPEIATPRQFVEVYKTQFEHFIESLNQQVINKVHPARSSIKRTHIREFPLQLASLRTPILWLINSLSTRTFRLRAIYFTSAEQSGVSLDRLNKKIEREYALTTQDQFPQSHNYRAYFIEGALHAFQTQTQRSIPSLTRTHRQLFSVLGSVAVAGLLWIGYQYLNTTYYLDEASKELIAYDTFTNQKNKQAVATYHLTQASTALEKISTRALSLPTIQNLKKQLNLNSHQQFKQQFVPSLLHEVEQVLVNAPSPSARYEALKIYLMLGQPKHFSSEVIFSWFHQLWQQQTFDEKNTLARKQALLKHFLSTPPKNIPINAQLITDARNYLNALPASYLFYSLLKTHFPQAKKDLTLDGFNVQNFAIPTYLTKNGFEKTLEQIPTLAQQLEAENWVLERQDLRELPTLLQQAYCYEYVIWWQNFMREIKLKPAQDFSEIHSLLLTLRQTNTINTFVDFIQQQLSPEPQENTLCTQTEAFQSISNERSCKTIVSANIAKIFNQEIASKFTELSLMSHSALERLTLTLQELEKFLNTLTMVQDQGKTAFNLVKSRFQDDGLSNPLSTLYSHTRQLPEPVAGWAKQIADDAWFSLINESRHYVNLQWQQEVYHDYQTTIANRYPFTANQTQDITLDDFNRFFSPKGNLTRFLHTYLQPFLDTSKPQWQLKQVDHYVLPISSDMINELIRANVITNMFFPNQVAKSQIDFSLQKLNLDPVVSALHLYLGENKLTDTQASDSLTQFHWPQSNARLVLNSIEGKHYELEELGPWAFFRMLQKVNVLVDEQDSSNLEILFEINGNSGRYLLRTHNQINPFIPGILNGFSLSESIV